MSDIFKLTSGETLSPVWQKVSDHLKSRLVIYRAKLEGDLSPEDTAKTRGMIAAVKAVLDIENTDFSQ